MSNTSPTHRMMRSIKITIKNPPTAPPTATPTTEALLDDSDPPGRLVDGTVAPLYVVGVAAHSHINLR